MPSPHNNKTMKKECKNADCFECERCEDEMDDPVGCSNPADDIKGVLYLIIAFFSMLIMLPFMLLINFFDYLKEKK